MTITKDQYMGTLTTEGILKERSIELLSTLFDAPSCMATASQLAEVLGYSDVAPVNSLIGQLGMRMANHLEITLPDRPSNSPGWWQIVATGEPTEKGFAWSLRDELSEALVELDLLQSFENKPFPETVDSRTLTEGAIRTVRVNKYERSPTARKICINEHGFTCKVCDFDFAKVYGSIGEGFVHVHHIVDLSQICEKYQVDPKNDLIPVCPNCHAMLHTKSPAMSIQELRKILSTETATT